MLWLWCRLAAAAQIRLLAQELPYATGATVKKKKKNPEITEIMQLAEKHFIRSVPGSDKWVKDPVLP